MFYNACGGLLQAFFFYDFASVTRGKITRAPAAWSGSSWAWISRRGRSVFFIGLF